MHGVDCFGVVDAAGVHRGDPETGIPAEAGELLQQVRDFPMAADPLRIGAAPTSLVPLSYVTPVRPPPGPCSSAPKPGALENAVRIADRCLPSSCSARDHLGAGFERQGSRVEQDVVVPRIAWIGAVEVFDVVDLEAV